MPMKKAGRHGKQLRKTEGEWEWLKNYRVWDANQKIFVYPENWIEPELRLPARFRASLDEAVAFICAKCGAKQSASAFASRTGKASAFCSLAKIGRALSSLRRSWSAICEKTYTTSIWAPSSLNILARRKRI
jgi:hypothetical protein